MALEKLGTSLHESLRKIFRVPIVDEAAVKELIRDIQRSLLQADVNVKLVLDVSKRIEERSLREKVPPGVSRREHVIKVVYEELTRFLGENPASLEVRVGRRNIFMLVGIQGSGKTTTAAKLARYFQKRGFKTAIVCSDTYRPGALAQLQQLVKEVNVPVYGDEKMKDSLKIAKGGLEKFEKYDIVIVDTAGRHKNEKSLVNEMKKLDDSIKPTEVIMVIDGTIGQQASVQAEAFHEATSIGSIIVAKLDGSARGGGALSAVAATGAPIKFIGTGERLEDLEAFVPSRFVGRLLGMGDIQSLVEKVREAEVEVPEKKVKEILSGKLTLADMYEQLEAIGKMGPFSRIIKMLPGFGYEIPEEKMDVAEDQMKRWRVIIQSMTPEERETPKVLNASRIRRVARGSGTTEKEVKTLVEQYFTMRKMMKTLRRKKLPFFGKKLPIR